MCPEMASRANGAACAKAFPGYGSLLQHAIVTPYHRGYVGEVKPARTLRLGHGPCTRLGGQARRDRLC
jgi:hypothetical protein